MSSVWRAASLACAVVLVTVTGTLLVTGRLPLGAAVSSAGTSALAVVGVMAYLETGLPLLSVLMPGEITVLVGGGLAAAGAVELADLLLVVWICSFTGDCTSYAAGRLLGRPYLGRRHGWLSLTPGQLSRLETSWERFGVMSVLVGRFLPVVRALTPFLAGAAGIRPRTFVLLDLAATGAFTVAFVGAGYAGTRAAAALGQLTLVVLLSGVLVLVAVGVHRRAGRTTTP